MKRIAGLCCAVSLVAVLACDRNERRDVNSARPGTDTQAPAAPIGDPLAVGNPERGSEGSRGEPSTTGDAMNTGSTNATNNAEPMKGDVKREADAEFKAAEGIKFDGDADLEQVANGVRIQVDIDNAPVGAKAIHIHEKGDCSNIRGKSMGEHFNPAGHPHGMPQAAQRHAGDLGNIVIEANGEGKLDIVAANVNLVPNDPMSILGRALVIHESKDVGTQPSGGAGAPIACAVIKAD